MKFFEQILKLCVIIGGGNMDNEIIEMAKIGDKEAQKQIYLGYKDKIYTLCFFRVGDTNDAEDLTQDIFLKVFKSIKRFKKGNFDGWIYRITMNHIINAAVRKQHFVELKENSATGKQGSIDEAIDIEAALKKMPGKFSLLLVLREKEGFNYKELSRIFGVPIGTIKSRLAKARELFKNFYGGKDE